MCLSKNPPKPLSAFTHILGRRSSGNITRFGIIGQDHGAGSWGSFLFNSGPRRPSCVAIPTAPFVFSFFILPSPNNPFCPCWWMLPEGRNQRVVDALFWQCGLWIPWIVLWSRLGVGRIKTSVTETLHTKQSQPMRAGRGTLVQNQLEDVCRFHYISTLSIHPSLSNSIQPDVLRIHNRHFFVKGTLCTWYQKHSSYMSSLPKATKSTVLASEDARKNSGPTPKRRRVSKSKKYRMAARSPAMLESAQ
jgi:hypothetical protein